MDIIWWEGNARSPSRFCGAYTTKYNYNTNHQDFYHSSSYGPASCAASLCTVLATLARGEIRTVRPWNLFVACCSFWSSLSPCCRLLAGFSNSFFFLCTRPWTKTEGASEFSQSITRKMIRLEILYMPIPLPITHSQDGLSSLKFCPFCLIRSSPSALEHVYFPTIVPPQCSHFKPILFIIPAPPPLRGSSPIFQKSEL